MKLSRMGFCVVPLLRYITIGADMKHLPERSILPGGKDKEVVPFLKIMLTEAIYMLKKIFKKVIAWFRPQSTPEPNPTLERLKVANEFWYECEAKRNKEKAQ